MEAKKKKAVDLTFEGGEMVPPIKGVYFNRYESIQKAKFGDNVFDIMSTSVDQQEMEIKIVEAFERARENIERHKARMEKNTGASVGTKAGEE